MCPTYMQVYVYAYANVYVYIFCCRVYDIVKKQSCEPATSFGLRTTKITLVPGPYAHAFKTLNTVRIYKDRNKDAKSYVGTLIIYLL